MLPGFIPLLAVLVFSFKQQRIRHEMKERMEERMLHRVVIADAEIRWAKKDKEIWVNGKMFDIKSMHRKNGTTVFYGLYDDEETALKKTLGKALNKDLNGNTALLANLFQCLQGSLPGQHAEATIAEHKSVFTLSHLIPQLPAWYHPVPTPPPLS